MFAQLILYPKYPLEDLAPALALAACFAIAFSEPASAQWHGDEYWTTWTNTAGYCRRSRRLKQDACADSCACQYKSEPQHIGWCSNVWAYPGYGCGSAQHHCGEGSYYEDGTGCVAVEYYASGQEAGGNKAACDRTNPCDIITGRKIHRELDIEIGSLRFERFYNSGSADPGITIGAYWRHSFDTRMDRLSLRSTEGNLAAPLLIPAHPQLRSDDYLSRDAACESGWEDIKLQHRGGSLAAASAHYSNMLCELRLAGERVGIISIGSATGYFARSKLPGGWGTLSSPVHTVTRPDGRLYTFKEVAPDSFEEVHGYPVYLIRLGTQWRFYDSDNSADLFEDGRLIERTLADGQRLYLSYDVLGRLDSVSDGRGVAITFHYNPRGQLTRTAFADAEIHYGYGENNGSLKSNNLLDVTYEDGSTKIYHYEDSNLPNHLTGITDERGIRFSTWAYDALGRAVLSMRAGGVDRTTIEYGQETRLVTDALGAKRIYTLDNVGYRQVISSITGDKCDDCSDGNRRESFYDEIGRVAQSIDWRGNVTEYRYDSKGRETARIEASGQVEQRSTLTDWHGSFRLPLRITQGNRVTEYLYDDAGRLLSETLSPAAP